MAHPAPYSNLLGPTSFPSSHFPFDSTSSVTYPAFSHSHSSELRSIPPTSVDVTVPHRTADTVTVFFAPLLAPHRCGSWPTCMIVLVPFSFGRRFKGIPAPWRDCGILLRLRAAVPVSGHSPKNIELRSLAANDFFLTRSPMFFRSPRKKHPLPWGAVPLAFGRPE
jgi:hypothetical protein